MIGLDNHHSRGNGIQQLFDFGRPLRHHERKSCVPGMPCTQKQHPANKQHFETCDKHMHHSALSQQCVMPLLSVVAVTAGLVIALCLRCDNNDIVITHIKVTA